MKKFLLILLCLFLQNTAFAENFYIENYEINLKVSENKTVQVTEDIQVEFTSSSHGIFRTIPHKNAIISNVRVNNNYTSSSNGSELTLKIGDPDRYVSGKQHYNIEYLYTINDSKNEFYFNIIGTDWPVRIENANFTVTMPKDFEFEKAGLSIGEYGTRGFNGGAFYRKTDNTIYGEITKPLEAYNGITLRIEVPEDYFTNAEEIREFRTRIIFALAILILIPYLIWFLFGKDEHVTPIVTFYPPENINCLEAEAVYNEQASNKGIAGLLIELAGKGYLKIDDSTENFSITKAKEYDGENELESSFLKALFEYSSSTVSFSQLRVSNNFYRRCLEIMTKVATTTGKNFFEASSLNILNKLGIFLCILGIAFLTILTTFNFNIESLQNNGLLLLFPTIAILVIISMRGHWFSIVWGLLFGGIPLLLIISEVGFNSENLPIIGLGIAGLIITAICLKQMPKKNKRGQAVMSELLGLKKFLEVAEKHRLETLAAENPSYFYDILPYAYILGVSDVWIKKFKDIVTPNPDWYSGREFNETRFDSLTSRILSTTVPTVENGGIKPSESSSHSSGGGGHSGGGHGGGGGGSW